MSRYLVVGDTSAKIEVVEVSVTHASLDDADIEMYCEWKKIEDVEDWKGTISRYSFFTTEATSRVLFASNAREALVYCITPTSGYAGNTIVAREDFFEWLHEEQAKTTEWAHWQLHKESKKNEDDLEF